jgi:large subunit ribosomal protein L25
MSELLRVPGGRLSIVDLKLDSTTYPVMMQEIQRTPISKEILHVDFHRIKMDEPVHARVPIVLTGEAAGLKLGGIVEHATSFLDIKTLPANIPTHIDVDVSALELNQTIHVADLKLPEGVEVLAPAADTVVAAVRIPAAAVSEATAAEAAAAEEPAAE